MANHKLLKPVQFEIPKGYSLSINGKKVENSQLRVMDSYCTLQYGRANETPKDYNIMLFPDGAGFFDSLRIDVNTKSQDKETGQQVMKLTLPST